MKYNFNEVIERRGTYSFKWDGLDFIVASGMTNRFDEDTLPLFTADMDLTCPQPMIDALHKTADQRIYGYTGCQCGGDYFEVVANWCRRAYEWIVAPDEIVYFNGTNEAIETAIKALVTPGSGVIVTKPIYGPIISCVKNAGCKVVATRLTVQDNQYGIDFEDFETKAKKPENTAFILCNPHNPTGRAFTEKELKKIVNICRVNGVVIISDDVHADIIRKGGRYTPIAAVAGGEGIITCTAISKTFNAAGLMMSNIIRQDQALLAKFRNAAGIRMATPFGIAAVISGYTECDEWLTQVNAYFDANIDWALGFLKKEMPKVNCFTPEGTYLLWMDFSAYQISPEDITRLIYQEANVLLEEGRSFDEEEGAYFQRICLSTRFELVKEAFERIARVFHGL